MTEKMRLNDEQWAQLVRLTASPVLDHDIKSTQISIRLISNGLVRQNSAGHFYLTEKGERRLGQGR